MGEIGVRYNVPTKFDVQSYGTVLKIVGDGGECVYYIQTSKDLEKIKWERSGFVFEKIYNHALSDNVSELIDIITK